MKNLLKIVLFLSLAIICSCDDDDSYITEDNILHTTINKTVIAGQTDTIINSKCYSLVCTIDTTALINKQIKLFTISNNDCVGSEVLKISEYDNITFNNYFIEDVIGANSNWASNSFLDAYNYYNDFYIGVNYIYPFDGEYKPKYYAWLHLSLSEDKQELTIIDMAKNLTEGNSILAGRVK